MRVDFRPLGHEVDDVVRPVLHCRVPALAAFLDDDLHHGGMQRILGIGRCGAAFNIMHIRSLIDDDQGSLKLTHLFRIDAEIGLQRFFQLYPFRDIDEGSARPHRTVQSSKFVVGIRNNAGKVFFQQLGILLQGRIGIQENNAFFLNLFQHVVIDGFRFILGVDASQKLLFRLWNSQFIKGFFNRFRHFLPIRFFLVAWADIVGIVIKIQAA